VAPISFFWWRRCITFCSPQILFLVAALQAFAIFGLPQPLAVPEQAAPDPDFPTVP
jgi:hypothetical protein